MATMRKKAKASEETLNLDSILFKCRDILRKARNSGSFFEKRDLMLTLIFLRFIGEKFEDGVVKLRKNLKAQGLDPDSPDNPGPVNPPPGPGTPVEKPVVDADGCQVVVWGKTVSIYDPSGKLLRQENIIDYTKSNVLGEYASLDNFIRKWSAEDKKETIRALLRERGIDLEAMKAEQDMSGVDDFDFICHVAFDRKPLTRRERAENVKKRDFFSRYSGAAREVLETLLDRYMNTGIYEIEQTEVLRLEDFKRFGKPGKIAKLFGGPAGYQKAVRELEEEIYKAG